MSRERTLAALRQLPEYAVRFLLARAAERVAKRAAANARRRARRQAQARAPPELADVQISVPEGFEIISTFDEGALLMAKKTTATKSTKAKPKPKGAKKKAAKRSNK